MTRDDVVDAAFLHEPVAEAWAERPPRKLLEASRKLLEAYRAAEGESQ